MKDIDYFIERERMFNKEHPKDELIFNAEFKEFGFLSYPNDFLKEGWITQYAKNLKTSPAYNNLHDYGLLAVEIVILYCFMGNLSQYFRDDYYMQYDEIPEESVAMQEVLDSILRKAPNNKTDTLYRFLKVGDRTEFDKGQIYTPTHSLTTTNENWGQDGDVYIISPLPENETNGREIFQLYNHGNENQVNFIKGTSFIITRIDIQDSGYKHIYMKELKKEISTVS